MEGFAFWIPASSACARLFWFRARVILLTDGPTRSIQRLPVRGKVPPFPPPEPPLLLVLLGAAPSPGPDRGLSPATLCFGHDDGSLTLPCPARRHTHQGGSGA